MIISHQFKYVFVELPRTGSTAISKELREHYGGSSILKKHSTYTDFLKTATPTERTYFVFAGVRNPLDKLVSLYFKYKYDHRNYGDPRSFRSSNLLVRLLMQNQFRFVQSGADFPAFFLKYYRLPYDDWSSLDHQHLDFVIRFEHLAADFAEVLGHLGIEPRRSLPVVNKTGDRSTDFWSYYTPEIRARAQWVFGPYCRRWGYSFPDDWRRDVSPLNQFAHEVANVPRQLYWRYLR